MDGAQVNQTEIDLKVESWLSAAIRSVTPRNPESIHIDDLLGLSAPRNAVALGVRCYSKLIRLLDGHELDRLLPVLTIPLRASERLDPVAVPWSRAEEEASSEPPSIYVVCREVAGMLQEAEEYRCPIEPSHRLPELGVKYSSYYRCFRWIEGLANDWEFERVIYLETYPSSLVL